MKAFASRRDIFNWKSEAQAAPQRSENVKYNQLLTERYKKICACFWEGPGADATDKNPVNFFYDMFASISQCHTLSTGSGDGPCSQAAGGANSDDCKLSATDIAHCAGTDLSDIAIHFAATNDVANNSELEVDNACWFPECQLPELINPSFKHKNYGLSTRNTELVLKTDVCHQEFCSSFCLLKNTIDVDGDLTLSDKARITMTADCDDKKACINHIAKTEPPQHAAPNYDSRIKSYADVLNTDGGDDDEEGNHYVEPTDSQFTWIWRILILLVCAIALWWGIGGNP
jgi:hypothetical protein